MAVPPRRARGAGPRATVRMSRSSPRLRNAEMARPLPPTLAQFGVGGQVAGRAGGMGNPSRPRLSLLFPTPLVCLPGKLVERGTCAGVHGLFPRALFGDLGMPAVAVEWLPRLRPRIPCPVTVPLVLCTLRVPPFFLFQIATKRLPPMMWFPWIWVWKTIQGACWMVRPPLYSPLRPARPPFFPLPFSFAFGFAGWVGTFGAALVPHFADHLERALHRQR